MSKFRFFCERSFTWFLKYCVAKFLEILATGLLEIGRFLQGNRSSFFEQLRMRCIELGSFGNKEKLRIAGFFASLPFLTS